MAWVEITTAPALLELGDDGEVKWNSSLQILLGDPKWVDLMWESSTRHLGVRQNNAPDGLPVIAEPENNEFKINATAALAAAGISVDDNVEAEPERWAQVSAPTGWADWFGYPPIFYITLPE